MNSLGRDIEINEVVVIRQQVLKPEYHSTESRLFRCTGGFGMKAFTSGHAIYGYFLDEADIRDPWEPTKTQYCRMEGQNIDPMETVRWQAAQTPKQEDDHEHVHDVSQ